MRLRLSRERFNESPHAQVSKMRKAALLSFLSVEAANVFTIFKGNLVTIKIKNFKSEITIEISNNVRTSNC